jgi:hypothetical protein
MEQYILTCPGRKIIKHDGFEVFVNKGSAHVHPWQKCAAGHLALLGCGEGPVLILEDDVLLAPDFETRLDRLMTVLPDPGLGMLYAGADIGLPCMQFPMTFPPGIQDWGTQAMFYTPRARRICQRLIEAYTLCDVATVVNDFRIPEPRPRPTQDGVHDGFDCVLFKQIRELQIPLLVHPGVQHMGLPSTCLSNKHRSEYFPVPEVLRKGKDGWH